MVTIKDELKGYFKTGAKPTEEQFGKLIDRGLYLDEKGNLGIGTESPSEKLEVNGNIKTHGIQLSQDIRHNGVPVMGFLESPLADPAIPIKAKVLTGEFQGDSTFLQISHGINNIHAISAIPYIIYTEPSVTSLIFRSDAGFLNIIGCSVTEKYIILNREGISNEKFQAAVFLLYLDR